MKILYFHQHFCTPGGSSGTRSYEFARRWVAEGHEVTIVCGRGFDFSLPDEKLFEIDGIKVITTGVKYSPTMGFAGRLKSFMAYALKSSWLAVRAKSYDLVLATSTPLTVAVPALIAKWFARRPVVFEVRDVWPDAAVEAGVLKNPVIIALARWLEGLIYNYADHIVPLSTGMADRITGKGVNAEKMTVIPNCSDTDLFPANPDREALRKQYGSENKFILLYTGAVNLANHIEYLVEVAARFKDDSGLEFWIVGEGNRYAYLHEQVEQRSLNNIRLFGKRPKSKLPEIAGAADVGLVTFIPPPVFYENSPNKFFDYIAAGLPVIFNRSTWLESYLEKYRCGYVCDVNDPNSMTEKIRWLREHPDECRAMGTRSRDLAEKEFSRDHMAQRYLKLFEDVLAGKHGSPAEVIS